MRLLFVTPYVPSPIRVRGYHLLRQLARQHDVALLTLWQGDQEQQDLVALQAHVPTVGVPLSRAHALANCLRSLPSTTPLQGAYCRSAELTWLLGRALARTPPASLAGVPMLLRAPFDLVHIEHLRAAYSRDAVPAGVPTLFDAVDSISLLQERTLASSHSTKQRALSLFELPRTRAYEARMLPRFDEVIVTAPRDRQALQALAPDASISVLPNGVDLEAFRPPPGPREPATIVFSGKMSYHANVTAVLHFVREIWPLVRQDRPEARFLVVGSNPPPVVQDLASDPAITVTGFVPDMREAVGRATVAVCPVTVKVGIQNKVLEAMALGLPVVTTPAGAEGLAAAPGEDMLVAPDAAAFAREVCQLLADPGFAERIARAGQRYVETHHRWDAVVGQLESLYARARQRQAAQAAHPSR